MAGLDVCRDNGWHYILVFKEGRLPAIFYSECEPETVYLNHSYEDAFLLLT